MSFVFSFPFERLVLENPQEPEFSSCVTYVRQFIPIPIIETPASLEPNSEPTEHAAILLDYKLPHIAYTTKLTDSEICFREANFKKNEETFRCLSLDAPEIRGYYFPD